MQPNLRKALLDACEQSLKPVDLEIGMDAALHQHAGAAHLQRFGNLLVNFFEVENVSIVGLGITLAILRQWPAAGAEGAVLRAVVCIVDIAIDDVGDDALGMQTAAHRVSLEAEANQVGRVEIVESLLASECHCFDSTK